MGGPLRPYPNEEEPVAFKVTVVNDGECQVHDVRSITSARRTAANAMLNRSVVQLADETMFAAERTRTMTLTTTRDLISAATTLLAWDGPTELNVHDMLVRIEGDPEAHEERAAAKTARRTDARWLESTRFPNPCVSCQCTVEKGERAWYQPKKGVWHAKCAPPEAASSRP